MLTNQTGLSQRPFDLLLSYHWPVDVQVQKTCHCILSVPESPLVPGRLYLILIEVVSIGQLYRTFHCSCLRFKQRRRAFFFIYLTFLIEMMKLDNDTYAESNGYPLPDLFSGLQLY